MLKWFFILLEKKVKGYCVAVSIKNGNLAVNVNTTLCRNEYIFVFNSKKTIRLIKVIKFQDTGR